MSFRDLVNQIPEIAKEWHSETLLNNTRNNLRRISLEASINTLMDKPDLHPSGKKCLIVSAGPSLYQQKSLEKINDFDGILVCADGAYIQCLRAGLRPNYVVTIDPHPTRIVRWFGDPDLEKNQENDDYFKRQDLDITFRENALKTNQENIILLSSCYPFADTVIASSAPTNVVNRSKNRYWFVPLVDDPDKPGLTQKMVDLTGLPAMNTGGTVGNACWVFAHTILKSPDIACIGMDFGYAEGTPYEQTQSWNMLKDLEDWKQYYPEVEGYWGRGYTDPTYFFYREALRDLLKAGEGRITNCTMGGFLTGWRVDFKSLEQWLKS